MPAPRLVLISPKGPLFLFQPETRTRNLKPDHQNQKPETWNLEPLFLLLFQPSTI